MKMASVSHGADKYIGTREERVLKKLLESFINDTGLPVCINAVLISCNVLKACSFSKTDVVLQTYMEMFTRGSLETWDTWSQPSQKYTSVYSDQLFKTDLVQQIASDGLESIKNRHDVEVFLVLLDFLRELDRHTEALEAIRTSTDETSIMVVLAEHLFSRLIPRKNYMVDNRSKHLPKQCPCNCKSEVKTGCTAIGSLGTWHGYADIFLDQKIAVSILNESRCEKYEDADEEYEENEDTNENDTELEPPPLKKLCKDDEKPHIGLFAEIKNDSLTKRDLMNMRTMDLVISECITNAFAQVNKHENLCGWLIPTFGCTPEFVVTVLYDPANDILLQCIQEFPLWEFSNTINLESVVKIWMLLNFPTFTVNNLSQKYKLKKSSFHQLAECALDRYKQVECQTKFDCIETDYYQNKLLPRLLAKGERAPPKE